MTALCHAARANNYLAIQELLDEGADPQLQDTQGRTALNHAQKMNKPKCVRLLQNPVVPKSKKVAASETKTKKTGDDVGNANSFASLLISDEESTAHPEGSVAGHEMSPEESSESEEEQPEEPEEAPTEKPDKAVGSPHQSRSPGKTTRGGKKNSKSHHKGGGNVKAAPKSDHDSDLALLEGHRRSFSAQLERYSHFSLEGQLADMGLCHMLLLLVCIVCIVYITRDLILHLVDMGQIEVGGYGEACVRTVSGTIGMLIIHFCVSIVFPVI